MFAIMAALHHREPHRQGQFIDLAMYEAMMTLIPEAVIDLTLNDADPQRAGNRDRLKAPHGIYPLPRQRHLGGDQRGWQTRLDAVLPRRGTWGMASRCPLRRRGRRLANVGALDAAVEGWTRRGQRRSRRSG